MVVYGKIYFKAYSNDLYISHKNNIAQLCFILGREVPAGCIGTNVKELSVGEFVEVC